MNCDSVKGLLNAYADCELDLVRTLEMDQHLHECQGCSAAVEQVRSLSSAIREKLPYHRAPEGLAKRIGRGVQPSTEAGPRTYRRTWLAAAAALLLFASIVGIVIPALADRSANRQLAQEIVAGHVRSLMAEHLTDVPSSDQHTVKPWFDGRIDFAPPVEDLSAQGFTLVGGRLDYIQQHSAAVLVYRYRKHPINLFIWPEDRGTSTSAATLTRDGYNLLHWNDRGMAFWAVSDASEQTLQALSDALQHNPTPAPTTAP